jgi:hypothetical protein
MKVAGLESDKVNGRCTELGNEELCDARNVALGVLKYID